MKGERLFRILGLVDEDLIEEADIASSPVASKRRFPRKRYLAAAACLGVVCALSFALLMNNSRGGSKSAPAESADANSGSGIAHDSEPLSVEGTTFMSYAGPVFPLTLTEETDGVTAERSTTWNFTPGTYLGSSEPRQWGAEVTDSYVLTNHTTRDILAMACYPVSGSLSNLAEEKTTITVDGTEQEAALQAGAYAGGFTNAGVDDGSTWNLKGPGSWTDYKTLLEDGSYQQAAFEDIPALNLPVTVYEFSDYVLPENAPDAATQAMEFTIDPDRTIVLTYNINGMSRNETSGWRQYSYFVPDGAGARRDTAPRMLVVLGEDIGSYTLQGYEDGGCDPREELAGVSCTVTRTETTLDAVLERLCRSYKEEVEWQLSVNAKSIFDILSLELFQDKAAELMIQYGMLAGENMADRYSDGRLGAIVSETLVQERVLYWTFPITIPAGDRVEITASFEKTPSFDYGCSGSENVGLQGYDYVTRLGSNLDFTVQKAALTNTDNIEITKQNFGFDLETGITEVLLDPNQAHYYLEIRPKK